MENVLLTPSKHDEYGIFATEFSDDNAPLLSRLCMGFAPGAKASPSFRPSGVAPVALPYMTLDVIVRMLSVCSASLCARVARKHVMKRSHTSAAISSTESMSFPKHGYSPSISNAVDNPVLSSRTTLTAACLMALSESATTLRPAMPNAMRRLGSVSMSAKKMAS